MIPNSYSIVRCPPSSCLLGTACPSGARHKCGRTGTRERGAGVVYFISNSVGLIKIGFASCMKVRFAQLQAATGDPLRLLSAIAGTYSLERAYHEALASDRVVGEWFQYTVRVALAALGLAVPAHRSGERRQLVWVDDPRAWLRSRAFDEAPIEPPEEGRQ